MKRLAMGCLFFLTASFVSVSHADTLFEEDWDGATDEFDIDPLVWTLSQAALDNDAYVVLDAVNGDPEGTGDKALMYRGWGLFEETIESVDTYARNTGGDALVMEFNIWVEPHTIPGIPNPPHHVGAERQGINGPFHDPNPDPGANPDPNATIGPDTIEFGTNGYWTVHGWAEASMFNGTPADPDPTMRLNPHPALRHTGNANISFNTFQSRFGHSESKFDDPTTPVHGGSLRVRYTLGATQGGKIEWLNVTRNPSEWVCANTDDGTALGADACDFRDGNLGPVIEIAPGDPPTTFQQGTSMLPNVRLGWFSRGHGDDPGTPDGDEGGRGNCDPNRESPPGTPQPCVPTLDMKTGFPRVGVFIDDIIVYAGAPTAFGACQLPAGAGGGGNCQILSEADCGAMGGSYLGDGTACPQGTSNIPGDCNQDGAFDLSDVIHLLGFLFQGNPEDLPCSTVAANLLLMDCNQDGGIDLSDAVYKLAFLFQGGPPPVQGEGCILIDDCPQHPGCP